MPPPLRALSRQLRLETGPDLRRRSWVFGLSPLGTLAAQLVSLFQMGLVRCLPDPPVGPFDSDRVGASDHAYSRLETPDGALMLVSYGATAALAAAGGADRAERHPALPLALAAKAGFDVVSAVRLAGDEWRENSAFCVYCQAATVASLVSLALALPEAGRAWRALTR